MQHRTTAAELKLAIQKIESCFLKYQLDYLYDRRKIRVIRKPVRCGWTFAHSWWSLKKRLWRDPDLPKLNEIFVSKNLITATEYVGYLRQWGRALEELDTGLLDMGKWTSELVRLPGGDIRIVSSDPDGFRGMGGDVTLDEIDFHDQQDKLYSTAQSRADWIPDGQISLFSSRSLNPMTWFSGFSETIRTKRDRNFSFYHVTLDDCIRDGLAFVQPGEHLSLLDGTEAGKQKCVEAFLAFHRSKCATEEDFRREYYWEASRQRQLVTPAVYDACIVRDDDGLASPTPDVLDVDRWSNYDLYLGVDCGRVHDLTVAWVLAHRVDDTKSDHLRDEYRTICVVALKNMSFAHQREILGPIICCPHITKGLIDMGTVGRELADSAQDETGGIVEAYAVTAPRKGMMLERMRAMIQQQRVSLPPDPPIRNSILSMRRETTASGNLTYAGGTADDHGDYAIALGLALEAAKQTLYPKMTSQSEAMAYSPAA